VKGRSSDDDDDDDNNKNNLTEMGCSHCGSGSSYNAFPQM
jgi:hypothetical protein